MKKKLWIVVLVITLLLTSCCQPVASPTPTVAPPTSMLEPELPFAQELQDALDNGLEEYGGMGISVAVIVPGYETWVGVSGVSQGTTPITPDTLFAAGSITKNFVAALVLQLAEEGLLTLDDPLHKWLPDYPNVDNTITIRQLLNHTSGIYNFRGPSFFGPILADPERFWTPEEVITTFVLEPYFPKGTDWHYSNAGYVLLGMIIEEATGSEISTELRNRFWNPLGLDSAPWAEALPENIAHGWIDLDGDGTLEDISALPGTAIYSAYGTAGSVFSTAEDLAKWSQALYHEGRVLSQQSLDQMLTFHSPTPDYPFGGYGLGVASFSLDSLHPDFLNGLKIWGHVGNAAGYTAVCLYVPEYGVSIGFMSNREQDEALYTTVNNLLSIIASHLEETP